MAGLPSNLVRFNIYSKSGPYLFLAANGNEVILTKANPSDESQQWYKVVTQDGSFAVVNCSTCSNGTYMAIKQVPVHKNVELKKFENLNDEYILWVETNDNDTDGYSNIRIPGYTNLSWDVNVQEGGRVRIDFTNNTPTQWWKFAPSSDCSRRPGEEKTTE